MVLPDWILIFVGNNLIWFVLLAIAYPFVLVYNKIKDKLSKRQNLRSEKHE